MINDYLHLNADDIKRFADISDSVRDKLPKPEDDKKRILFDGMCPSDLITANTVPLRAFIIKPERNMGQIKEVLYLTPDGEGSIGIAVKIHNTKYSLLVTGFDGVDCLVPRPDTLQVNGRPVRIAEDDLDAWGNLVGYFSLLLRAWYGIQICLLNPYVKDVFRAEDKKETHFNPDGKKRKYKVHYVRHHYLTQEAQKSLSPTSDGGRLRHTFAWYVCGHWRHYQNGRTIFIQPYWKGPLRETKLCEPRERIVS